MNDAVSNDRKRERGTSLFEVTLALGLMAAVLGSVAGLFVLGAGGVKSGRSSSEALAGARTILEEMHDWGFDQLYSEFGLDGSANTYVIDTRTNTETTAWHSKLNEVLPGAYATISLASLEPGSPMLSDSTQVRVIVTIHWQEGERHRRVRLGTVRL